MGDGGSAEAGCDTVSHKPADVAFKQQRLKAWQPILDPKWVAAAYFVVGIVFVPTGVFFQKLSSEIVELKTIYESHLKDGTKADVTGCEIGNNPNRMYLEERTCGFEMKVGDRDMKPPVLVHYELNNFHQNYRKYKDSKDLSQLTGSLEQNIVSADDCAPLNVIGDIRINPCGLIANTLFNDVIKLKSVVGPDGKEISAPMIETGVAWQSDIEWKFNQPNGFNFEQCPSCDDCDCDTQLDDNGNKKWSCEEPYKDENGVCFRYFYPNDPKTQYLYETYPMVVNPLEGVTNEHFVVWMRVAALPQFRKLYGYINEEIPAGSTLTFEIMANFEVERIKGSKALVVSTNNIFGGKNDFLGLFFIVTGAVALVLGALLSAKMIISPRKLGDPSYLHFKAE